MIKELVFCDIDGTLRNSENSVSKKNIDTIKKLKDINVGFVLTTGRSRQFVVKLAKEVGASNYVIATNGADVYDYENNVEIYKSCISLEAIKLIYSIANKLNCKLLFKCGDTNFINFFYKTEIPAKVFNESELEKIYNMGVAQINVMTLNLKDMLAAINQIETIKDITIASKSNALIDETFTHPKGKDYSIDINNSDCEKGLGILKLSNYLGVPQTKTVTIGDGMNDLSMFKYSQIKVAMENSVSQLKQQATDITASNNNDGVAAFLEKHYRLK